MVVRSTSPASLSSATVTAFRARLHGEVLTSSDRGYDDARRVWNAMVDKRPALIARCADDDDIAAAVHFAREQDLALSIRGGGHNVAGLAVTDGGLMIDCAPMKRIAIDPQTQTARAQPGVLWGEFDAVT